MAKPMKRRRTNFKDSRIGDAGLPLAKKLAPAIRKWLEENWTPAMNPNDMAHIANEVVYVESRAMNLFAKHFEYCSRRGL